MANTYLTRTQTAGTSTQKMTFSAWVKRGELGSYTGLLNCYQANANRNGIYFQPADTLAVYFLTGDTTQLYFETNRKFRDTNAWYHIVVRIDTTQGNATHRCRIYINGEEETSFSYSMGGSQNSSFSCINQNNLDLEVGRMQYGSTVTAYYTGSMSHVHFIDGEDRTPDYFGETDSTTGEWKIKTSISGVTYGNNGFFILKDGNSVTDQSGNSNNFTVGGGTLTKTEDSPSNVFATMNPLNSYWSGGTFSNGNNTVVLPNKNGAWNTGTLGMTSGKYYWEIKCTGTSNGEELQMGIADKSPIGNASSTAGKAFGFSSNGEYGIYSWNGGFIGNAVANPYTSYGSSTTNGIAMFAVDLDNNKFYGGANGTWFASGNPATGANGKTIQAVADTVDGCYYPAISTFQGYTGTAEVNFGNGYFGTTAVSSAGTNASGNGIFEYDVPTGYTALTTKGLNL
jgi:hypothetical protein